jgi:hypothetical protein
VITAFISCTKCCNPIFSESWCCDSVFTDPTRYAAYVSFSLQGNSGLSSSNHAIILGSKGKEDLMCALTILSNAMAKFMQLLFRRSLQKDTGFLKGWMIVRFWILCWPNLGLFLLKGLITIRSIILF